MSTPSPGGFSLAFLRERAVQRRILVATLAFAVLGFLYATFAPKWYRAALTVVPSTPPKSAGLSSLLGADLGGVAASLGAAVGGADVARIAAVLKSNTVTDAVIEKFDLKTRYRARYLESARDELWRHCEATALPKPNLVQLSCEDKDPAFVQALLGHFAEVGNQVFRRVGSGSASEEARFLEARVAELRRQAEAAGDRMRTFQETYRIVDIDSQAKAVVAAMAAVNSQRIAKQMELGWSRAYATPEEPSSRQAAAQIAVMEDRLRDLEAVDVPAADSAAGKKGPGMFPKALAVPKLRSEYERLYRDRRVAEALLVFATERLEGARANEARDVSTFQVMDPPQIPARPARPKRGETTFVAAMIGFMAALGFEGVRAWRAGRATGRPT